MFVDLEAPKFIEDMKDRCVKEGEQATFYTKVKGVPDPEVRW